MAVENYSASQGTADITHAISHVISTSAQTVSDVLRATNSKFKWVIPISIWGRVSLQDVTGAESLFLRRT